MSMADTARVLTALETLQRYIHNWASGKGWWDSEEQKNIPSKIALMHSELSEALEAYRNKLPEGYGLTIKDTYWCSDDGGVYFDNLNWQTDRPIEEREPLKPEGFGIELADCIIRILDTAGFLGIDIGRAILDKMVYNQTRPYKHGGKKC